MDVVLFPHGSFFHGLEQITRDRSPRGHFPRG